MPISDDEYDSIHGYEQNESHPASVSKAELRKTNKPIMEKKRRARINQCLGELKDLILEAMKKDPARHSKLEKADILEMTVRHLQSAQRRGLAAAAAADPAVLPRFRQGFSDCAAEAARFLSRPPALPAPARNRLRQHLEACVSALHQSVPAPRDVSGYHLPGGISWSSGCTTVGTPSSRLPLEARLAFSGMEFSQCEESRVSAFRAVRNRGGPPSPVTSVSDCDSSDSDPETPPRLSLAATFPTPPSQTSFDESSPETQRQTVSSTTVSPESKTEESKFVSAGLPRRLKGAPKRLDPASAESPGDGRESPSRSTADYSLTPSVGRKRQYNAHRIIIGAPGASASETPAKSVKIACAKVSSSQNAEDIYRPFDVIMDRNYGNIENMRGNLRVDDQRDNGTEAGGSQSTGGNADMWRPW